MLFAMAGLSFLGSRDTNAQAASAALPGASVPDAKAPPIFVLNSRDANVSVIDAATFTELRRIPSGKEPHHLYLTPDEKSLLVANALSNSITFIDPRTAEVQRTVTGILDPYQLRFSPDMKWFVTVANRLNHVDLYRWMPSDAQQPLQLAARLDAPRTPSHVTNDALSTTAYVSLQDSDELTAIDLNTQRPKWKIPVGKMPADVYLAANDQRLLVGMTGSDGVEVYDVSQSQPSLIQKIPTGAGAHAFRGWGDRRHVLVSNRVANTISRIDTQTLTVVESYPAPGGPDCMDLMDDGRTILVTSRWAGKLTMIDTTRREVVRQVSVGRSPHGVWTLAHAPRR